MRFVVQRSSDGQFYWFLRGANGEVMCASETMKAKQSCIDAIKAIQRDAPRRFDHRHDRIGRDHRPGHDPSPRKRSSEVLELGRESRG